MSEAMFEIFGRIQVEFVRQVNPGRQVTAKQSGQYVHQEEPSLVIAEFFRYAVRISAWLSVFDRIIHLEKAAIEAKAPNDGKAPAQPPLTTLSAVMNRIKTVR